MQVGIEALHVFGGTVSLDVAMLARHRGLDHGRFENLLMKEKTVSLPTEDAVSFAVNAARPVVDALSPAEKDRIELLVTCTESGLDFGKSLSTYVHDQLKLNRNCRMFELKNACYSGTAGLQMAINFVLARTSPGAKALVVATDLSRTFLTAETEASLQGNWSFTEPSGGSGAVAALVSELPHVLEIDVGANGYYGYEVMDACRPFPDGDAGDADLSLLSYLDCCENAYLEYKKRIAEVDYATSFGYLVFHTPFGGMIKGAHRMMMRKMTKARAADIEPDFQRRVTPGLNYCQRVGNIMGASTLLSLASTIDHGNFEHPQRLGCFSYGSGCCSEFFSGVVTAEGQRRVRRMGIQRQLDQRHPLTIEQYESLLRGVGAIAFGTRDAQAQCDLVPRTAGSSGEPRLFLKEINGYHRKYEWVQ